MGSLDADTNILKERRLTVIFTACTISAYQPDPKTKKAVPFGAAFS
jgi:hypothetical protein